jgi:acyl carrier protein
VNAAATLRALLAEVTGRPLAEVEALPEETPLLDGGLALTSLRGADLLSRVHEALGVDVAGEDLALDSLRTVGTLTEFVAARADPPTLKPTRPS